MIAMQYEPRCEKMDLLHPSIDLTLEPKAPRSRELLEHRFMESGDPGLDNSNLLETEFKVLRLATICINIMSIFDVFL